MAAACAVLSLFIREPQFQGQTKEKLSTPDAQRLVENVVRDHFDHWLAENPQEADRLLDFVIDQAEDRLQAQAGKGRRAQIGDAQAAPARQARRLHAATRRQAPRFSWSRAIRAGGSAKQARDRETQAILPLRGKILNVASAAADKLAQNQELADLMQALGCGTGAKYRDDDLRYERVIIMTDADVDGAHIASLLMTFFYREMPRADRRRPSLPRHAAALSPHAGRQDRLCARRRASRAAAEDGVQVATRKVEITRFKGLGEMMPAQLKETTMKPGQRTLVQRARSPTTSDKETERSRRTPDGQEAGTALPVHPGKRASSRRRKWMFRAVLFGRSRV